MIEPWTLITVEPVYRLTNDHHAEAMVVALLRAGLWLESDGTPAHPVVVQRAQWKQGQHLRLTLYALRPSLGDQPYSYVWLRHDERGGAASVCVPPEQVELSHVMPLPPMHLLGEHGLPSPSRVCIADIQTGFAGGYGLHAIQWHLWTWVFPPQPVGAS